jgi:hypothetical protein
VGPRNHQLARDQGGLPWIYKYKDSEGRIAADLLIYIDDLRTTGSTEEEAWQVARRSVSICSYYHRTIHDAARKRRKPSQTPGAWAGSVVHSDQDELDVLVSEDKWEKTKTIVDRLVAVEEANRLGSQVGLETMKLLSDRFPNLCVASLPHYGPLSQGAPSDD